MDLELKEIFTRAISLDGDERTKFLDEVCSARQRSEIDSLIEAHERRDVKDLIRDAIDDPDTIGPYKVLGRLGSGGSGDVYRSDGEHGEVAIKILARHLAGSSRARMTFAREWDLTTLLNHPGIARPIERLEIAGRVCVVYELVHGEPFADWVRGSRSEAEVLGVLAKVADALHYAHSRGVVHRDIKPSNIIVRPDGSPVLIDFGIAKAIGSRATSTLAGAGSQGYIAPEQADGDDAHPTADVYSLGVILRESVGTLGRRRRLVVNAATALDPGDRYSSAEAIAQDLRALIAGGPLLAPRVGLARRTWRGAHRHPVVTSILLLAVFSAFGAGLALRTDRDRATLRITGLGDDAEILVGWFDPTTDGFSPPAPFDGGAIEPGFLRVTVRDSVGFSEFSRHVRSGDHLELTPEIRPTEDVTVDMTLVGDVWLDIDEVTNAEYREFAEATSRPPPLWWGVVYDRAWDDLPIVSVTWEDAQAYAEWRGKRLPTWQEWYSVASGPDGRSVPWGEPTSREAIRERANAGQISFSSMQNMPEDEAGIRVILSNLWPASRPLEDQVGSVVHLLGNAAEWTESPLFDWDTGEPRFDRRLIAGFAWADPGAFVPTLDHKQEHTVSAAMAGRGFRCAKTAR